MESSENRPMPGAFTTRDGAAYEVTAEGSLGLLALGDVGLIAWRRARTAARLRDAETSLKIHPEADRDAV